MLRSLLAALLGLAIASIGLLWLGLRASLPQLEGAIAIRSRLAAEGTSPATREVILERDALGSATVRAAGLADAAFGLGFAHAQDRLFQMDLARRLPAGELAALVGAAALPQDRRARRFGLRAVAEGVIAAASSEELRVLDAYAEGVNAGIGNLRARPWEYVLLGARPKPWQAVDSVLVVHSMWWQLQYGDLERERFRRKLAQALDTRQPDAADPGLRGDTVRRIMRFLYARGTEWDAPLFETAQERALALGDRDRFESLPVPGPEIIDLRAAEEPVASARTQPPMQASEAREFGEGDETIDAAAAGSNAWALAGPRVRGGGALVANDMHLGLGVPPTWYRARLELRSLRLQLNGLTLPGVPSLVTGSNGRIAWGFTNPNGDWADVVDVSCNLARNRYATLAGPREFTSRVERIEVKDGDPERFVVRDSPLGVLFAEDDDARAGRCSLARWLVREAGATNLRAFELQRTASVDDALRLAPELGVPHLNMIVGDRTGRIAWTIAGRIPEGDAGPSTRGAIAWRTADATPRIVDPDTRSVWSANARMIDGESEATIAGDEAESGAGYDLGARAAQIRDGLQALQVPAAPSDMLDLQLDDRALFLARWRTLLLGLLDDEALRNQPRRAELRRLAVTWEGRAAIDSVSYRVVREFRVRAEGATWLMLMSAFEVAPPFDAAPRQFEGALWRLVTEQPEHWLSPRSQAGTWREFLLAQVDATAESLLAQCRLSSACVWGEAQPVRLQHPLSRALPWLSRWIDAPVLRLPGDHDMPRVQAGAFGATQRFAVVPGREGEGYLQVAGGPSAHPLSPFRLAGFADWANGTPTPFLPGPAAHKLVLRLSSRDPPTADAP